MKDYNKEHELIRRKVWLEGWVNASNQVNLNSSIRSYPSIIKWADALLGDFDERFKQFDDSLD